MSIKRVILTSGQILKTPFLCQYLMIVIGIYVALYPKAQSALQHFVGDFARLLFPGANLKKIADLKVYGNLKQKNYYTNMYYFFKYYSILLNPGWSTAVIINLNLYGVLSFCGDGT